jgi:hypothetical protein
VDVCIIRAKASHFKSNFSRSLHPFVKRCTPFWGKIYLSLKSIGIIKRFDEFLIKYGIGIIRYLTSNKAPEGYVSACGTCGGSSLTRKKMELEVLEIRVLCNLRICFRYNYIKIVLGGIKY